MKKDSIKFEYCLFVKAEIKGIFKIKNPKDRFLFQFIKFSKPKANYLINKGVRDVVQSWKLEGEHRIKILHSGLFNIGEGIYMGNNINQSGTKDFLLLFHEKEKKQIQFFLVKNKNPKNKLRFGLDFFKYLKDLNLINL